METHNGMEDEPAGLLERRLAADGDAPRIARAMAREFAVDLGDHHAANLYLVVSELVTNAVVHAPGDDLTFRLLRRPRAIRVEVRDPGTDGFDWPDGSEDGQRPHGLELVNAFTDRCGVDSVPQTVAWCELDVDD